jgi:hypothetical protein
MIAEYPFLGEFQAGLLALLIRKPEKVLGVVGPPHFTNLVHVDIARIAVEAYEKHGVDNFRLSKAALMELVRNYLGRKRRDVWPVYRRYLKQLYQRPLDDEPVHCSNESETLSDRRTTATHSSRRSAASTLSSLIRFTRSLTNSRLMPAEKESPKSPDPGTSKPHTGCAPLRPTLG